MHLSAKNNTNQNKRKKLGVPMQILALSCDILAKTQKYNDFCTATKFELSSNYKNMFKQKTKNI